MKDENRKAMWASKNNPKKRKRQRKRVVKKRVKRNRLKLKKTTLRTKDGTYIQHDSAEEVIFSKDGTEAYPKLEGTVISKDLLVGENRKAFHEMTKVDNAKREWAETIDFDDKGNIREIDISRGTTAEESNSGRPSVRARLNPNDKVVIHNHPSTGLVYVDEWNRPSGGDIASHIIIAQRGNFDLKEEYIKHPDGRYTRYKIVDKAKAFSKSQKVEFDESINLDERNRRRKISHSLSDYEIESNYQKIRDEQYDLTNEKKIINSEGKKVIENGRKDFARRMELINNDETMSRSKKRELRRKIVSDKQNLDQKVSVEYGKKNPKYISEKMTNDKRNMIIEKRTFEKWVKYMRKEWGIEIKRMKKGFKMPFVIGES